MSTPDPNTPPAVPPVAPAAPPAPAAAPPTPAPAAPAPALGPDGQPFDPERAMALINRLREENREGEAAKTELAQIKQQQETEQERIQRERDEAEARATAAAETAAAATATLRRGNLLAELAKPEHGIVDVQAAAALITGVEYDDQGQPTNLTTQEGETPSLLSRFLTEKSYLKQQAPTPTPAPAPSLNGGGGSNPPAGPVLTPEQLEAARKFGMSPERYAALNGVQTLSDFEAVNKPTQ